MGEQRKGSKSEINPWIVSYVLCVALSLVNAFVSSIDISQFVC